MRGAGHLCCTALRCETSGVAVTVCPASQARHTRSTSRYRAALAKINNPPTGCCLSTALRCSTTAAGWGFRVECAVECEVIRQVGAVRL